MLCTASAGVQPDVVRGRRIWVTCTHCIEIAKAASRAAVLVVVDCCPCRETATQDSPSKWGARRRTRPISYRNEEMSSTARPAEVVWLLQSLSYFHLYSWDDSHLGFTSNHLPLTPSSSQTSAALATHGIIRTESVLLISAPRRPSRRRAPADTPAPARSKAMERTLSERAVAVIASAGK